MVRDTKRPSCRLHIIRARDVPLAVILRRGPSSWYHLILWNMSRNSFDEGAWLKGRIYEDKCDLSPDGQLFIYSALQGSRSGTSYTHAWTAVSRPPWLTALVLWPLGTTYGGGGQFTDNRRLTVHFDPHFNPPHPDHPLRGLKVSGGNVDCRLAVWRNAKHDVPDADWCGSDHRGRTIYTKGGKLFCREDNGDLELADFSGQTPDPQPAPEWAHHMPK